MKLIDFLQQLGADAGRHDADHVRDAIVASDLAADQKAQLLAGNTAALRMAVGASPSMNCILAPPKDTPGRDEEEEIGTGYARRHVANG